MVGHGVLRLTDQTGQLPHPPVAACQLGQQPPPQRITRKSQERRRRRIAWAAESVATLENTSIWFDASAARHESYPHRSGPDCGGASDPVPALPGDRVDLKLLPWVDSLRQDHREVGRVVCRGRPGRDLWCLVDLAGRAGTPGLVVHRRRSRRPGIRVCRDAATGRELRSDPRGIWRCPWPGSLVWGVIDDKFRPTGGPSLAVVCLIGVAVIRDGP